MDERTCVALKKNNFMIDYVCGRPSKGGKIVRQNKPCKSFVQPPPSPARPSPAPYTSQQFSPHTSPLPSLSQSTTPTTISSSISESISNADIAKEELVLRKERDELLALLEKASQVNDRNKRVFNQVVADRRQCRQDREECEANLEECVSTVQEQNAQCATEKDHLKSRIVILEGKLAECQQKRKKCESDKAKCEESKALCEAEQMFIDDFIEEIQILPQSHPITVPGLAGVPTQIARMRVPTYAEATADIPPLINLLAGYRSPVIDDIERSIMRLEQLYIEQ